MLPFACDYMEGAHEAILKRLMETNMEPMQGYGADDYCAAAREKIRKICECPQADVYFLVGGTQTNQTVIDSMLAPYEGVIAAETGHVSTHEAGAIEFVGHKVLTLPQEQGKIRADGLKCYMEDFYQDDSHEHMVFPGMVYLSYPTEYGTLYSRKELEDIAKVCRQYELPLYVDGARLGYGLESPMSDLTMAQLAQICDVFYIGGTKVGALCGEAVVFTKENTPKHFMTQVKQHGALLAKGRLLGIQFDALFTEDLYFEISRHAVRMAMELKALFQKKGYSLYLDSPTNQQFVILDHRKVKDLEEKVAFEVWEKVDEDHVAVRFATSWATRREDVEALGKLL